LPFPKKFRICTQTESVEVFAMTLFHLSPEYGSTRDGTVKVDDDNEEGRPKLLKAESTTTTAASDSGSEDTPYDAPSNEYVLNIAFISFVSFMGVQAFFAMIANSQSMLADSEAMSVDALTYLFNMCAERIKKRPPTAEELMLPLAVREHRIEMKRLYLELIPPLISVSTLIVVTIMAVQDAWQTLFEEEGGEEEDVSAGLMLFFSGLNLGLDALNVTCFARANQAYGLQATDDECCPPKYSEKAKLLDQNMTGMQGSPDHVPRKTLFEKLFGKVNLNMCSAWTVRELLGRSLLLLECTRADSSPSLFDFFAAHLCGYFAQHRCFGGSRHCLYLRRCVSGPGRLLGCHCRVGHHSPFVDSTHPRPGCHRKPDYH
jgi:Co/Zn/Cd efflux system component